MTIQFPLQLQQTPLPGNKERVAPTLIRDQGIDRAARSDQRWFQPMLVRHRVAAPAQFFRGAFHFPRRPRSPPFRASRPFGLRQIEAAFSRLAKTLATARGKVAIIGDFTGSELFRRPEELVVLQNVES